MIKTLSPYYLYVPLVNPNTSVVCQSFLLKIYVWNGTKTSVPLTADYEKTYINAADSNGTQKINISRLVNDFIDFSCVQSLVTSLENGNNQVWCKTEVYYDDEPENAQLISVNLAVRGYGYFLDGENPDVPTNKIMLTGNEFKVNRNGFFVLPIVMNEPTPVTPTLTIDSINEVDIDTQEITFSTNIDYSVVNLRFSLAGADDWTIWGTTFTSSPFQIFFPVVAPYDFQLFAFDPLTETDVYSNIFTVSP